MEPVRTVEEQAEAALTVAGHRFTTGRRAVVKRLATAPHPLSFDELRRWGSEELAVSTAYRTLHLLERYGIVRRVGLNGEAPRFELDFDDESRHHHLHCINCGKVQDVELAPSLEQPLMETLDSIAVASGFAPETHHVELTGRCGTCRSA